jgi:hypothetical protein
MRPVIGHAVSSVTEGVPAGRIPVTRRGGTGVRAVVLAGLMTATAAPAGAEPEPLPAPADVVAAPLAGAAPAGPPPEAAPPVDDGRVESSPPQTTEAPDGSTLTISAEDETQTPVAPLTTAVSTREYAVGGVFNGEVAGTGAETPEGIFEVGYQIGCGIDMSTANGVSMTGTAGVSPSIGFIGLDFPNVVADGILPGIAGTFNGAITVGLKPGIINVVPVTKKPYTGAEPWVSISNFRVKIDGCVEESFIRSYAMLSHETDSGEAILSWYGITKAV